MKMSETFQNKKTFLDQCTTKNMCICEVFDLSKITNEIEFIDRASENINFLIQNNIIELPKFKKKLTQYKPTENIIILKFGHADFAKITINHNISILEYNVFSNIKQIFKGTTAQCLTHAEQDFQKLITCFL